MDPFNPNTRHDLVLHFDARNSNPNGDPDAGNRPRMDHRTGHGEVTAVSVHQKARLFGAQEENVLIQPDDRSLQEREEELLDEHTREAILKNFWDARLFGHVTTGDSYENASIWGPFQMSDAVSLDPIEVENRTITRSVGHKKQGDSHGTMGSKPVVRYGLYRSVGAYMPNGRGNASNYVTESDLRLLYRSLLRGWEYSTSASRPQVQGRSLAVITHEDPLGNAPRAHTTNLFSYRTDEEPPRSFNDYRAVAQKSPENTEMHLFRPYGDGLKEDGGLKAEAQVRAEMSEKAV